MGGAREKFKLDLLDGSLDSPSLEEKMSLLDLSSPSGVSRFTPSKNGADSIQRNNLENINRGKSIIIIIEPGRQPLKHLNSLYRVP